ncbi:MAG: hypothetical protein ACTTJK_01725 [Phocaeicola sp.]|uniref:hypothetical protein n=1 Tax=Phocaeicola sp. TaxID=2773926 RepID=UPI003F9EDE22
MEALIYKTRKRVVCVLTLSLLFWGMAISGFSQTVTLHTPMGNAVSAMQRTEIFSDAEKAQYRQQVLQEYNNVEVIGDATTTYNCHSYAWNMSEGGPVCWLNSVPDLHYYWDDGSYVETIESQAEKVRYYAGNHSAIKDPQNNNMYISKWGALPLVRHPLNVGPPEYSMNHRKFYKHKELEVSGSVMIGKNEQKTFSINYIPYGTTLTWDYSTSLFTKVSASGKNIVLKLKSPTIIGDGSLTAIIKDSQGNVKHTITHYIGANGPHYSYVHVRIIRSSDGVQVYPNGPGLCRNRYYYAYLTVPVNLSVTWSPSHVQILSSSDSMMYFKVDDAGYSVLHIYGVVAEYGVSKQIFGVTIPGGGCQ